MKGSKVESVFEGSRAGQVRMRVSYLRLSSVGTVYFIGACHVVDFKFDHHSQIDSTISLND